MTELIKKQYPLHWLVWNNSYEDLNKLLTENKNDKEMRDPRGRTPLMLAVTLGHLESVRILLQHSTNVNTENRDGWNVVQEAVATGDPELLQLVLERRDYQRYTSRIGGIPGLLQKLKEAPDFYVEMKWEFTSWVPLVSRMCPSDTYKVYKQGSNVRIDTTLLGFDTTSWQRGNKTYIFKGRSDSAVMMEVDHEKEEVYTDEMRTISSADLQFMHPSEDAVSARLTTPVVTTYIDTDKISFERNKSGIWGWRSDKTEEVNGHECKVFGANNVELVTKTRTEHLAESDKAKARTPKTPLQSFLGIAESEEQSHSPTGDEPSEEVTSIGNPCNITPQEYFSDIDLNGRDIGRPREVNTKIQKFKATLWLAEKYPLTLQEQIMPIVDLMAISSSHFAKLKDFIQMQLPAGFPVKIEIPLFHVLNARITFGNIFGLDEDIPGVVRVGDEDNLSCVLDDSCFEPPSGYVAQGGEVRRQFSIEEEDELLQFAIQQSLIDAGSEGDEVDIWEALKAQRPSRPTTPNLQAEEDRQLQSQRSPSRRASAPPALLAPCKQVQHSKSAPHSPRRNQAIQASLQLYHRGEIGSTCSGDEGAGSLIASLPEREPPDGVEAVDAELQMALALSQQERDHEERQRREEEEIMQQVLQLSLTEK